MIYKIDKNEPLDFAEICLLLKGKQVQFHKIDKSVAATTKEKLDSFKTLTNKSPLEYGDAIIITDNSEISTIMCIHKEICSASNVGELIMNYLGYNEVWRPFEIVTVFNELDLEIEEHE